MRTQRNPLRWAFGVLAVMCTAVAFVVPSAPVAHADPQGDAVAAIDAAWVGAGGDTSPLGPKVGGVYPAGAGFGQDFASGAIFFSPGTGARSMFGAILDKYRAVGGPADSGLGFPNIDEGPGRAPESRNVTFDSPEGAVIFWTPATGAWVVRGIINAAWDRLGGSSGPLGVPTGDETYSGETISQTFAGGQISYDTAAKTFTTTPPELAGQLADLPLPDDATSAINVAWRVAGGPTGQLGAKTGDQYAVGDGGAGQDFNGGKIFYSPDTGAHIVSGTILEKYEEAGGPTGELGFPVTNEADGDIPGSRVSTFGAEGEPAIVWTPEHGAVIVRGPMKAAWDELGGSGGDLGVPIADQTGDDTITQNFSGGQVTYNSSNNTFSTQPPELAERLSGLELAQQPAPSATSAQPSAQDESDAVSGGQSWYPWAILGLAVVLVLALAGFLVARRRGAGGPAVDQTGDYGPMPGDDRSEFEPTKFERSEFERGGLADSADTRDDADRGLWATAPSAQTSGPSTPADHDSDDTAYLAAQPPWAKREPGATPWSGADVPSESGAEPVSGPALFTHHGAHEGDDLDAQVDEQDPDDVDTAPTRVQSDPDAPSGRHAAAPAEDSRPPWLTDADYEPPASNSLFAPVYGAPPPPADGPLAEHDPRAYGGDHEQSEHQQYDHGQTDYPDYPESDYTEPVEETPQPEHYGHPGYDHSESDHGAESAYDPQDYAQPEELGAGAASPTGFSSAPPAIHLPLEDPDEAPEGYPVKGSMRTGTYHPPGSDSYEVTVAEIWFASEELAEANGFTKAE
ncbi:hypothetical protein BCA37_13090 [Mycobacterium sp. djl-10]|nr:hypothetical protein BCA37_13090 [Mycobacterium sp. djl-10]